MAVFFFAVLSTSCTREAGKGAPPADLALKNAAIYTVDGTRRWAESVAIHNGRITYVGPDRDLPAHIGPQTKVIDLEGRMLLPGFQDIHIHPISAGMEALACDLNGLEGVEAYVAKIEECAAARPGDGWITGGGWLMSAFGPGGIARKELIDAVVPDRPVMLSSADGHTLWVNGKALELAGITNETPDPPDGRIDRDPATGAALGSLQEGAASLVYDRAPPATAAEREAGLKYSIELLNGFGITSIQDASVDEEELKAYRALDQQGELSLEVVASIWWERDEGLEQMDDILRLRREYTGGHVHAGTVKIMQDGVMENYTAAMLEPYLVPGDVRGIPMVEPEKLKGIVTRLDAEGFQVHFHAIGDAAIRQSLDAVAAARAANGGRDHRHHVSHLEVIHPDDLPRFRELGVVANFQPLWACNDPYITDLTVPFIGPERSKWLYTIGAVQRSGAVVAFGSDWSVSSPNPFWQIETALLRLCVPGDPTPPLLPTEAISLPEAIAAFTINAAYTNHDEQDTGSIEVGKRANLVVLDRNLFAISPNEISETKALVTLFEGKVVHGDLAAL
jgi:predicted amidohydrolase YtcJ